jgi:flagellar secretion chaperone FliS
MYGGNIAEAYQQVGITTADPGRLVILCYEGAIENLKMAITYYGTGALEKKAEALAKALDFIGELNRALDFEKGGEVATSLHVLYNYASRRIMEGDLKRNMKAFDEVIHILTELKSAWEEILAGPQRSHMVRPALGGQETGPSLLHKIEV